jgi:hypothetical protein
MDSYGSVIIQFKEDWQATEEQWQTTLESWRDEKARQFESRYWDSIRQLADSMLEKLQETGNTIEESRARIPG